MYRSRKQIEKKLGQSKYIFQQISKFNNRIFVNGGLDEETGTRPLLTYLSSFLAHTRSILQYAHKEAKECGKIAKYQTCVNEKPIFKFFKDLRDSDIHEYTIGAISTIAVRAPIASSETASTIQTTEPATFLVEGLSDLDSPKERNNDVNITIALSKRIEINDKLLKSLEAEGKNDLVEAAKRGEELYEQQEFEGETDLFELCEIYLGELEDFVNRGVKEGFIS